VTANFERSEQQSTTSRRLPRSKKTVRGRQVRLLCARWQSRPHEPGAASGDCAPSAMPSGVVTRCHPACGDRRAVVLGRSATETGTAPWDHGLGAGAELRFQACSTEALTGDRRQLHARSQNAHVGWLSDRLRVKIRHLRFFVGLAPYEVVI
jgi:hypothetical protein